MNREKIFKEENDYLLWNIFDKRFFSSWKDESHPLNSTAEIELYITNKCNQHCEYCYLYNNDKIYPKDGNNQENIISNLKIFLSWLIKKDYLYIPKFSLFSGEIWHTSLGLEVLKAILEAIQKGLKVKQIMIPTNAFFTQKDETLQPILQLREEFLLYDTSLCFSISIDGAKIEDTNRPLNSTDVTHNDDYYEKIFSFSKYTGNLFHPMVAATTIEKWEENFFWWKEQIKKYGLPNVHSSAMMLEVRNNDWTPEKIKSYCKFLRTLALDFFENVCESNLKTFSEFVLGNSYFPEDFAYLPWVLTKAGNQPSCSIPYQFCVRLGDLAICPCHRTAYDKNLYGYFNVDKGEITGISSKNFYLAGRILTANNILCSPKCNNCIYREYCIKGCYGSQLENHKDMFMSIDELCLFFSEKIKTIVQIYQELGCLEYFKTIPINSVSYPTAKQILNFVEELKDAKEI